MTYDIGDTRRPNLVISVYDASTVVTLTVLSPLGVEQILAVTQSPAGTWTANASYTLTAPGRWYERWLATNAVTGLGAGAASVPVDVVATPPAAGPYASGAYATTTDYANIIGGDLPTDLPRRLRVASRQIRDEVFSGVYDPAGSAQIAALKEATCEQVAWGLANGWEGGYPTELSGRAVSIGSLSIGAAAAGSAGGALSVSLLAPGAFSVLQQAGLTGSQPSTDLFWG